MKSINFDSVEVYYLREGLNLLKDNIVESPVDEEKEKVIWFNKKAEISMLDDMILRITKVIEENEKENNEDDFF